VLLLLFDIDGTLLGSAAEAHRDAMLEALAEVHGVRPTARTLRGVSPAGRTDPEIARDAFLEFAKATDQDIAQVARKLDAEKLRGWLKEKRTPSERLSVYALLLGACGTNADARFLQSLLDDTSERTINADTCPAERVPRRATIASATAVRVSANCRASTVCPFTYVVLARSVVRRRSGERTWQGLLR